jgi:hypothetical protein
MAKNGDSEQKLFHYVLRLRRVCAGLVLLVELIIRALLNDRRRIRIFHGQAFFGARFHARVARDAAEPVDLPVFRRLGHNDGLGGAFLLAYAAKNAFVYFDGDAAAGVLEKRPLFKRVQARCGTRQNAARDDFCNSHL